MKAKSYYYFIADILHDIEWSTKELKLFIKSGKFDDLTDNEKDHVNRSLIILENTIQAIEKKLGATTTAPIGINNQ